MGLKNPVIDAENKQPVTFGGDAIWQEVETRKFELACRDMVVEFPFVTVPVHWTGKLPVICEHRADAIVAVVELWLLSVLTVTPFTVNERLLLPQTSLQVVPVHTGNSCSPPVITAVPSTVWAEAEPNQNVLNKATTMRRILLDFMLHPLLLVPYFNESELDLCQH